MKYIFLLFLFCSPLFAKEILVGSGLSSQTQGRHSPALYAGYANADRAFTFQSVGVATELYYHSAIQLNYFFRRELGTFWTRKMLLGVGPSVFYSQFGYREKKNAKSEIDTDLNFGPGFQVQMNFTDNFFMSIESILGIRGIYSLVLVFQSNTTLNIGVSF